MDALPSFHLLREAIAVRVPAAHRPLLRPLLICVAVVAQGLMPHQHSAEHQHCVAEPPFCHLFREEDFPSDFVETVRQIFEDEIRTFRTIYGDLTVHYLALGFTAAEADGLVNAQHVWPDYLL
jgi:hypothetical protein